MSAPLLGEGVWKRSIADKLAQSVQLICLRGPLAFRRSTAALAPASERQNSAQAALHAKHDAKALPPLRIALKRGTSLAGHNAGGDDTRTAREWGYKPRPQEPHSLHQLAVTGRRP